MEYNLPSTVGPLRSSHNGTVVPCVPYNVSPLGQLPTPAREDGSSLNGTGLPFSLAIREGLLRNRHAALPPRAV
jgi:hypothetical protein